MKTITEILNIGDAEIIHTILTARKKSFRKSLEETESEYDPWRHKVMDPLVRKKKTVNVKTGQTDLLTGKPIYKAKKVERCRVAIPIQRIITERTLGFIISKPVEYFADGILTDEQTAVVNSVKDVFRDNKMKYFDKRLIRNLFRCRECAELWYFTLDADNKPETMRVTLLSPLAGDKLYPHWDSYGRMDGFAREYKIVEDNGDVVWYFDVYDDCNVHNFILQKSGWQKNGTPKKHGFTKIPVIYYRQEETEWECVQPIIERIEELLSNWGDTNDYFGSPSYFFRGKLKGFAEKGEQGKVYEGDGADTDMKVLSWDSSPTSVAGELANLFSIVFSYTQTPDISFESMKAIGNNTSGAAIRLMFTDPHMKASVKTELLGEMFTRRYNLVQNGQCHTIKPISNRITKDIHVEPVFTPYMPKNEVEEVDLIMKSTGGRATMSQAEGIRLNPKVSNAAMVAKEIENEERIERSSDFETSAFATEKE